MPVFSRQTLVSVQNIPLYDIVSMHVRLSRVGGNWRGLSPFSQEKSPSFYVRTDVNRFKDFSGGMAGDGIKFIQEIEKLTFPEAVESLAERFNIPLEYENPDPRQRERRSLRRELLDIHDYATEFYHQAFLEKNETGDGIRNYWTESRHFSLEDAKEWKIGFAPSEDHSLVATLIKKGFSVDALRDSGLFFPPRNAPQQVDRYQPRFRGRLMIPIHNVQGQVIAFTARQTEWTPERDPAKDAKYVNSPETPIFHKGGMLFNLQRAFQAVRESDRFLLVEGQLDALRCTSLGMAFAVAPQGSGVTEDQLRLLLRHTHKLDVLLDGDSAGTKAALRLIPIAFRVGLEVRFLPLPAGSDPDDYFREHGKDGLDVLEDNAIGAMPFAVQTLLPENPGAVDRENVLRTIFGFLENIDSPVRQSSLLDEATEETGVSLEASRKAFSLHLGERQRSIARGADRRGAEEESGEEKGPSPALTSSEGEILWIVLKDAEWAERILQVINLDWIDESKIEGKALSHILNEIHAGNWENLDDFVSHLEDSDLRDCFSSYLVDEKQIIDEPAFLNSSLSALYRQFLKRRKDVLQRELETESGNAESFQRVFKEFQGVQKQIMNFQPPVLLLS